MTSDSDESYDPHARMHESFPRVDSGSTQMAGDVLPLRPNSPAPADFSAVQGQEANKRSISNIAAGGPKSVDKTNLVLGPGMRK